MSDKKAEKLRERMNELSAMEWSDIRALEMFEGCTDYANIIDKRVSIRTSYNRKRNRALWWYEHGFDIKVLVGVVVFVSILIWWMV